MIFHKCLKGVKFEEKLARTGRKEYENKKILIMIKKKSEIQS